MQRISSCVFVVSSLLLAAISPAMAAFPERAITLVVPFAAGGPTDALARLLGQRLSEVIKQPIIIENVGGAGSMLGTARAAKAPPDGYTILINDLALPSAPYLRKSLPINVRTDLTPIGLINAGPLILIARKSMRADTAAQMFALFKAEQTNIKLAMGYRYEFAHVRPPDTAGARCYVHVGSLSRRRPGLERPARWYTRHPV